MIRAQHAVLPGIIGGVLFIIFAAGFLAGTRSVIASNQSPVAVMSGETAQEQQPTPAAETASDPQPSAVDGCAISARFPQSVRQWCDTIQSNAATVGLDPNLIASVILQESGGDPQAFSKSGAVGLMQVMPRDGISSKFQCINGPCFANRPSMDELYDPQFNVAYGTNMLANLINRSGSAREALKSYGPMDMGYQYADIILSIYSRYTAE